MFNTEVPNALEIVLESIADKKQVLVRYKTQFKEPSDRKIEPVGVFHESGFWYFTGYCTLRNDYRLFRMDRIIRIEKTDQTFSRNHPKLSDLRHSELSMPVTTVRFKTSKKIASYMGTAKYDYGFISEIEEGDDVIMTFETRFLNYGFDRWYMMYADESEILEPQELKESVQRMINRITERIAI